MSAEGKDTERSTVRTYVPTYQKEEWHRQADAMGMSLSEFVRTMVQSGRSDFEVPDIEDTGGDTDDPTTPEKADPEGANPRGQPLETRILDALDSEGHHSWDELVGTLTDDIEDRMEETLEDLQRRNRIAYSGRNGGYTLLDDVER
jgi:hypothetical protein